MKHLGDITKISGYEVPIVDVVVGGSPCQDLSVAGKREGLAGERSGLFMEQLRIIKEMRDGVSKELRSRGSDEYIRPRYMVWENVPGAFSSNKGEDFRVVLEEIARVADKTAVIPRPPKGKWSNSGAVMEDGWSIAWRVHDAQFWGVPQRRKRIALVADFGGDTAPEILFERESVPGNIEKGGNEGQGTATDAERSIRETISFQERGGKPGGGKGILIQKDRIGTLSTLNNQSVLCIQGNCIDRSDTAGCNGKGWRENESYTLNTIDRHAVAYRKKGHPQNAEQGQGWEQTETNDTLNAFDNGESRTPTIVLDNHPQDSRFKIKEDGVFPTGHDIRSAKFTDDEITDPLTATDYKDPIKINDCRRTYQDITGTLDCGIAKGTGNQLANSDMFIANTSVVRRLTPLEAERLQSYPDGWTNIGEWVDSKGKRHKDADSPRYKALGNSIALPFWEWMAKRMKPYLGNNPTMASLFDGIGGFPLVFTRAGFTPVWASEIEEFPMAVTKLRFPSEEEQ